MITIDTREPLEIVDNLDAQEFYDYSLQKLDQGDYFLDNHQQLLVERKTVPDFINSMDELKTKLHRVKQQHTTALLVEGDYKVTSSTLLTREGDAWRERLQLKSFHNYLFSLQLRGVMILRTRSLAETAALLINVHEYLSKVDEPYVPVKDAEPVDALAMIPGISRTQAQSLLKEFSTLAHAVTMIDDWRRIKGIGNKTVRKAKEFLGTHNVSVLATTAVAEDNADIDALLEDTDTDTDTEKWLSDLDEMIEEESTEGEKNAKKG